MRRRILLLVVGMTTLVIIAFAIPMALLIRSTVAQHNQDQAQNQARAVALSIRGLTAEQIKTYVTKLSENTGRPTSVQLGTSSTFIGSTPADDVERPNPSGGSGELQPGGFGPSDPDRPPGSGGGGE